MKKTRTELLEVRKNFKKKIIGGQMERSRDSCVLIFRNLGPLGFGYTVISLLPKSILAVSLTNLFPGIYCSVSGGLICQ